jgi:hypothetical protein
VVEVRVGGRDSRHTVAGKTGTAAKIDPTDVLDVAAWRRSSASFRPRSHADHGHGRRATQLLWRRGRRSSVQEIARFNLQHLEIPPDASQHQTPPRLTSQ